MSEINQTKTLIGIKRSWLLAIFLNVPIILGVVIFDYYYGAQSLLPYMGFDSFFLPLYILIFELPHIIASLLGFVDRGYITTYKRHLFLGVPIMLLCVYAIFQFQFVTAVVIFLVVTMYHVIKQQTGIGHFFFIPKDKLHTAWTWSLITGTALVYLAFGLTNVSEIATEKITSVGLVIILAGGWLFALMIAWKVKRPLAVTYVTLIMLMFTASYYMMLLGYLFFAFLVVRIVHDVTAFVFYVTHDMNRNADVSCNYIYRWLPYRPWSLLIIVPLIAIFINAAIIVSTSDPVFFYLIVMILGFSHYYLESLIWKRGAPHRQYVRVV